jgi:hypothetical protein
LVCRAAVVFTWFRLCDSSESLHLRLIVYRQYHGQDRTRLVTSFRLSSSKNSIMHSCCSAYATLGDRRYQRGRCRSLDIMVSPTSCAITYIYCCSLILHMGRQIYNPNDSQDSMTTRVCAMHVYMYADTYMYQDGVAGLGLI